MPESMLTCDLRFNSCLLCPCGTKLACWLMLALRVQPPLVAVRLFAPFDSFFTFLSLNCIFIACLTYLYARDAVHRLPNHIFLLQLWSGIQRSCNQTSTPTDAPFAGPTPRALRPWACYIRASSAW